MYLPNKFGNAFIPSLSVVISGVVIFKGIVYWSFTSLINCFASSIEILKSTPNTCGKTSNGSST